MYQNRGFEKYYFIFSKNRKTGYSQNTGIHVTVKKYFCTINIDYCCVVNKSISKLKLTHIGLMQTFSCPYGEQKQFFPYLNTEQTLTYLSHDPFNPFTTGFLAGALIHDQIRPYRGERVKHQNCSSMVREWSRIDIK